MYEIARNGSRFTPCKRLHLEPQIDIYNFVQIRLPTWL